MTFEEVLDQAIALLQRRGRVTYRTLQRQFQLDDEALNDLKDELLYAHPEVHDDAGRGLIWTSDPSTAPSAATAPAGTPEPAPLAYTPPYLAEKILTSRSALEGERKQVTVLFADLKGSTELIKDLDPEAAQQLLDPALHRMMDAVHRYEGTVNQVLGDGIMALFGAPLAHEDHALRACYAALAMQAALRAYAAEVRHAQGLELHMRVGLNSGEVVVRTISNNLHMDYSAVGQTTHLAARMEQLAAPGSIHLTAETLQLVEGLMQIIPLEPVPVKGLPDPIAVFELVEAGPARTRLQALAARELTRFVGRHTELQALRQALERAGAGHGQLVAVIGEPGVGKSRLFAEFMAAPLTQGWWLLETNAISYEKATPYLPIRDLLKASFQIDDWDTEGAVREKVDKCLTLDVALQPARSALLALLDVRVEDPEWQTLDPSQRRLRIIESVRRLLLRQSQVQPLLISVENLHWIDAGTQAVLDSLVEGLPTARILLLTNYRPEYQHGWGSKTYYTQLRLDPLPPARAAEVLQALLGDDLSLVPLKHLLIERTGGNPFFLEESVRTLVEAQVLVGGQGAYRLAKDVTATQVPATVQAVLAARIDRLPPEAKRLLQTAAVIGTEVPFPLLVAIAELPETELHRGLAYLQAGEFLYERSLFPELVYTFKHALTHEVAYGGLLHERLGMAGIPSVFSRSGLTRCLAELGAFAAGIAHGAEAVRLAEAADQPYTLINACYGLGFLYLSKGDLSEAAAVLERGLQLGQTGNILAWFLEIASALGLTYALAGRVGEALPLLEQAMGHVARIRTTAHYVLCLAGLSEAYLLAGHIENAVELARRALALARARKERGFEAYILQLLGEMQAQRDPPEVEPAADHYRHALILAEELEMRPLQAHCHRGLGTLYAKRGRPAQARAALSTAIELYRAMEMQFWLPQAETTLAQVG